MRRLKASRIAWRCLGSREEDPLRRKWTKCSGKRALDDDGGDDGDDGGDEEGEVYPPSGREFGGGGGWVTKR